ncbi:MAG: glycosyltransferase [Bacteroidales bacterium]
MNKKFNILICPLEWGLGHAGRMIPLASKLRESGHNVYIGTGNEHQSFFRNELAGLSYIYFPGFKPGYSRILPQYIALLLRTPLLIYHTIAEHLRLKRLIRRYDIDIVLSDNRFGLWNRSVKTVYITHQPLIPFPQKLRSLEWIGILLHRFIIKKYDFCFIPDLPGGINVSGRLSHGVKLPSNTKFIGILSRFGIPGPSTVKEINYFPHNTLILSGPEPQRGMLRQKLAGILKDKEPPTVILEGKPSDTYIPVSSGNIISYNHLPTAAMKKLITESENIISRSGYTVVMELVSLGRSALLIPTPGQTEQEYLAGYLSENGWFTAVSQNKLDDGLIFPERKAIVADEILNESRILLEKALDELLKEPEGET